MAATNAVISAAIADAEALAVTPPQMVALLDKAIADAHTDGIATANYTIGGRSRQMAIADAVSLRKYYAGLGGNSGGMIFVGVEF